MEYKYELTINLAPARKDAKLSITYLHDGLVSSLSVIDEVHILGKTFRFKYLERNEKGNFVATYE